MRSQILHRDRASKSSPNGAAREHLRQAAATTREGVRDLGTAAKELAASEVSRLGERVHGLQGEVLSQVKEKPMKSLLIAAGAGVLLGLLIRRA